MVQLAIDCDCELDCKYFMSNILALVLDGKHRKNTILASIVR